MRNYINYFLCIFASQLQKVMVMGEILKKIDALGGIITEAGIKYASRLVLLLILLSTAGCNRRSSVDEKMDLADSLMMSKPDSALMVLEGIPASDVKGKERSARYALLKSMALDKNYIDTTTFDVLQPAIDYYVKHGSPDEQLRTYYYQGRIYQNQGNNDLAMQSFMWGKEFCQEASDTLTIANLMVA